MFGLVARLRSTWNGMRGRHAVEADMADEFQLHMELRAADLARSGLSPEAAARQARLEFGSTEHHAHHARRARALDAVDRLRFSWLDVKLGLRMLVRYPGLTIVGGLAMAFAIWVGASTFEFIDQLVDPTLPLRNGERVVAVELFNAETSKREPHVALELARWRTEAHTIERLGAYRPRRSALIEGTTVGETLNLAEISASAFTYAPAAPLLGRVLVVDDEREGAPPVLVLGYKAWRSRFRGDNGVVGRTVRVGGVETTIVGVMPDGFAFPSIEQGWLPLRLPQVALPADGPQLSLFASLAEGATIASAEAELERLTRQQAIVSPETHRHLHARVKAYSRSVIDLSAVQESVILGINVFLVMLLVLVCANVALLMFARAATRETEIVVRTALGAGRGRIIGQFFAEALVLGAVAATIGLVATGAGLRWWMGAFESSEGPLPFWFTPEVSLETVLYVGLLTLIGAAVAGILPAVKVTRGLGHRLRESGAGGGGPRLGGIWTAVIVTQIALTIAFPVSTWIGQREIRSFHSLDVGFAEREFLTGRLQMDPLSERPDSSGAEAERFRLAQEKLIAQLEREPGITGVTYAERVARMYHPHHLVEVDEGGAAPKNPRWNGYRVSSIEVANNYFDVLGAPVRGRQFTTGDTHVAIVNESFVRIVLGGRQPIGRRIRYTFHEFGPEIAADAPPGPWYEIIGVVRDLGFADYNPEDPKYAGIYLPATPGVLRPVHLAIHVEGDAGAIGNRAQVLADQVDHALRLERVQVIGDLADRDIRFYTFWITITTIVSAIALVLSLAGIYAVMSYTVARRTREIGIRVALGADRRGLLLTTFRRPLRQVALGVLAGALLVTALVAVIAGASFSLVTVGQVVAYSVAMFGVCLLASVVPTRRVLAIAPTDALKADA